MSFYPKHKFGEILAEIHTVADVFTAPTRYLLLKHENGTFFTCQQNLQDGGFMYGHYDMNHGDALNDFITRFSERTYKKMNDRVKPGAIIEITIGVYKRQGRVISAKLPSVMHQDGCFDIHYELLTDKGGLPVFAGPLGHWKQYTDGGTVKIIKDAP
jgi:hypothetical protein